MFADTTMFKLMLLGSTIVALCGSNTSIAAEGPLEPTYRVIVTGGPGDGLKRLKMFNKTLMAELGVADLVLADVGCEGCERLYSSPEPTTLVYYIPRSTIIVIAFALTWRSIQASNSGHDMFAMQVDRVPPSGVPDCGADPLCKPRAACKPTNYCDKPYGGFCNACN